LPGQPPARRFSLCGIRCDRAEAAYVAKTQTILHGAPMRIVIYDLDRTLTEKPTFTPFLVFAAARVAPWRLLLLPAWVVMMVVHKLGLCDRTTLKRGGMRLMLGQPDRAQLGEVAMAFARSRLDLLTPGARRAVVRDRQAGCTLVIATASYALYAEPFGKLLHVDEIIGTPWDEASSVGTNCYGPEKLARVKAWFDTLGVERSAASIRAVSDSFADAPLLDWADEAWFVTSGQRAARRASARGWLPVDFSR
jgi:phosphatidylglycerophosphatase C